MAERPAADEIVGTTQAAQMLGVTPNRVRQLVMSGQLPAARVGREYALRRGDLTAYLEKPPGRPRHPRHV